MAELIQIEKLHPGPDCDGRACALRTLRHEILAELDVVHAIRLYLQRVRREGPPRKVMPCILYYEPHVVIAGEVDRRGDILR